MRPWAGSVTPAVKAADGAIGGVGGVEDEKRFGAVEAGHRGKVEAVDGEFALAFEGVVDGEQVEK
jgi:hypothetical protein